MKAKEVLKLLGVSRVTLSTYVKTGVIKATLLPNGFYDYHDDSVYTFLGRSNRVNVIYARVSTYKQKSDLKRQIQYLSSYCDENDINIDHIYSDISSGIDFNRQQFESLLESVFDNKIDTVYITYRDRLSRLSFLTIEAVFNKFGTKIIPVFDDDNNDLNELFDEVSSLMHYFTTKKYSNRRSNK